MPPEIEVHKSKYLGFYTVMSGLTFKVSSWNIPPILVRLEQNARNVTLIAWKCWIFICEMLRNYERIHFAAFWTHARPKAANANSLKLANDTHCIRGFYMCKYVQYLCTYLRIVVVWLRNWPFVIALWWKIGAESTKAFVDTNRLDVWL